MSKVTSKLKVFDYPTIVFHWVFALLFVVAFIVAKTFDDESAQFSYHALAGIVMIGIVVLRVIWGFIGTKYARFSSFKLNPNDLIDYFKNILSGKSLKTIGRNPASSYAALMMLAFTIILGVTGIGMSKGIYKDFFEEVHEFAAHGFLVTVIVHIAGVLFHQIRNKDSIALSILTGDKHYTENEQEISNKRPFVAIFFIILIASFLLYLNDNFNRNTQNLNLFGYSLQIGENEKEHSKSQKKIYNNKKEHDKDEEEDDDD